jgi:transposase InsO family protein
VLAIAPSAYDARRAAVADPAQRSARVQRDDARASRIDTLWHDAHAVCGATKVWKALRRQDVTVARCTVERLMRRLGLRGVVRGRVPCTTTPDAAAPCPQDLVQRDFSAAAPNRLWVADFTYVATCRGVVYVAFVIDVCSWRIVGWRAHTTMRTELVLDALEQALHGRALDGQLVVHADPGSRSLAIRYTARPADVGAAPSVGGVGDAHDNALAETVIGWYETEVIHRRGPWRGFEDVEYATLEWVAWFDTQRLLGPLGHVPPAEYEAAFHQAQLVESAGSERT